jgi:hypothetical protein
VRLKVSKAVAAAIEQDVAEINQVTQIIQVKVASNKRYTDALITDAGFDPATFGKYELIQENGESFMVSHNAAQPTEEK